MIWPSNFSQNTLHYKRSSNIFNLTTQTVLVNIGLCQVSAVLHVLTKAFDQSPLSKMVAPDKYHVGKMSDLVHIKDCATPERNFC